MWPRVIVVVHLEIEECACLSALRCGKNLRVAVLRVVSRHRLAEFAARVTLVVVMFAIRVCAQTWWLVLDERVSLCASAPLSLSLYSLMMIEIRIRRFLAE